MFTRLILCISISFMFGQYYELDINPTGESHLVILQDSIEGLDVGDEIGIFDTEGVLATVEAGQSAEYGEVLVGTAVWTGDQLSIATIMSIDLSDFAGPVLGGAVDGNGVSVKVVRNGFEYDTTLEITTGGEFGDLFTVISSLELLGDGNCVVDLDCTGQCGGDAVEDCDGVCNGDAVIDECGVCGGEGLYCTELSFGVVDTSSLEILIDSPINITSFEFHIDSIAEFGLVGSGGLAEEYGFVVSSSFDYYQYRTIITGFGGTIPAGSGILTNLDYVCNYPGTNAACIIDESITINQTYEGNFVGDCAQVGDIVEGCTDQEACNYNSYATVEDNSCEYPEENFDCNGNCIVDADCAGECGGSAIVDECGECNGDNSSCSDCAGTPNGDASLDECGVCNGDGSSCEVYIELEITTTLDAPIEDEEELEAFEEDFESYMETELGLPEGTVEVISVTFVETRDVEVIIEFAVVLTEEELSETEFDTETIEEQIEETVADVEEEVGEGLPEFIEGCTDSEANNYNPDANIDDGSCEIDSGDSGGGDDAIDYCLDLHFGANLISFYALPEDASIGNMMSSLEGVVTGVIGEGVAASPNGSGGFVGNLSTINPKSGYWVKVNTGADLCLTDAFAVDPGMVYDLHFGANLISFPYNGSIALLDALPSDVINLFTGFIGEGEAASPNGSGGFVGNMSAFRGGRGYWAKASQGFDFSYIIDGNARATYDDQSISSEYVQSSAQSFYLISDILFSANEQIEEGDMIRVYNNNVIVGSVEWEGPNTMIPVMGDDGSDYSIGYCDMHTKPEFVLTKADTGVEYNITGNIPSWESNEIFQVGDVYATVALLPEEHAIAGVYPNPFNPSTNITIELMKAENAVLSIYNAAGQEVSSLWSGMLSEGSHSFVWDGAGQPSGIYFARLHVGADVSTAKLMLIK